MELVVSQIINGISGSAELFLVAIGLVITFGMLDVVNMAHGEMIMLGPSSFCGGGYPDRHCNGTYRSIDRTFSDKKDLW